MERRLGTELQQNFHGVIPTYFSNPNCSKDQLQYAAYFKAMKELEFFLQNPQDNIQLISSIAKHLPHFQPSKERFIKFYETFPINILFNMFISGIENDIKNDIIKIIAIFSHCQFFPFEIFFQTSSEGSPTFLFHLISFMSFTKPSYLHFYFDIFNQIITKFPESRDILLNDQIINKLPNPESIKSTLLPQNQRKNPLIHHQDYYLFIIKCLQIPIPLSPVHLQLFGEVILSFLHMSTEPNTKSIKEINLKIVAIIIKSLSKIPLVHYPLLHESINAVIATEIVHIDEPSVASSVLKYLKKQLNPNDFVSLILAYLFSTKYNIIRKRCMVKLINNAEQYKSIVPISFFDTILEKIDLQNYELKKLSMKILMCYFTSTQQINEKFIHCLVYFAQDDEIGPICLQFLMKLLTSNCAQNYIQFLLNDLVEIEQLQESTNETIFDAAIDLLDLIQKFQSQSQSKLSY